jgi:uncharacterized membrane protein
MLSQPPTLLSLLFTILSTTHTSIARPQASKELLESQYHYLSERSCAGTVCGWNGLLCCSSGQSCSTNSAGQAQCIAGSQQVNAQNANGQWQYYTTTYTASELTIITSTYSSFFGAQATPAPAPAVTATSCLIANNESPCGTICCAMGQYCAYAGQCVGSNGAGASSSYFASVITQAATSTATAFIRPTSNAQITVTTTGSATTTVAFMTPSASGTGASSAAGMTSTTTNNGLSPGAIAGIVIGVLAGLLLLFLLCAFFCFKGLLDTLLSLLGIRNRKRKETTIIEERRHRHSGGGTAAGGGGRRWFGTGPSRVDRPKKKSSGIGGLGWVAGLLAALAICLGLQRKRTEKKQKSEYSASSYSYTDGSYTSESE